MGILYTRIDGLPMTRNDMQTRLLAIIDMAVGIKKLVESEPARWADMDITSVTKVAQVCADEIKREAEYLLPAERGSR